MTTCLGIVLTALPFICFTLFFFYITSIRKKALYQQFNSFSERFGAMLPPPGGILINLPFFDTTINRRPVRISVRQRGKNKTRYSRFEMNVHDITFEFVITQADFATDIGKVLKMEDFAVKTNSPERFKEIFDEVIREELIRTLKANHGYSLRLSDGKLSYETIGEFQSPTFNTEFASILELATRIAERIDGQPTISIPEPPVMTVYTQPVQPSRKWNDWPEDEQYLKRLTRDLIGGQFKKEEDRCFYVIKYRKRELVLEYFYDNEPRVLNISLTVTQKFWLRMLPQTGEDHPDEIRVSDPYVDKMFHIHSDQKEAAKKFLESISKNGSLNWLQPFDRFEINKGRAMFTITNPKRQNFLRAALEQTLGHVLQLLQAYEEQRLAMSISQSASPDHICPYCREDLNADKELILTCNLCHTAHHQSCLTENKQCTTWGCLATESDFQ
jgi:hypothetical protein